MTTLNLFLIFSMTVVMYLYYYIIGETVFGLLKKRLLFPFSHAFFSPLLGYAAFAYLFFALFYLTTNFWCILFIFMIIPLSCLLVCKKKSITFQKIPALTLFLSSVVSLFSLYVLYPVFLNGLYLLHHPMFDHMKIAFISSIAQSGVPVINPFCTSPEYTYYYFLYYVPSAVMKIIFNSTSYEAELSSQMLRSLLGIPLMVGCVSALKKTECSWLETIICFLFSIMIRPIEGLVPQNHHGIDSILTTIVWTPNTFMASSLFILSLIWLYQNSWKQPYVPALLLSVALGMSPYVYFVAFTGLGLFYLYDLYLTHEKKSLFIKICSFAGLVLLFSMPFLLIQYGSKFVHGTPIAFEIYQWAKISNPQIRLIGFWSIFLLSQMPIIFLINFKFFNFKDIRKYAIFYFPILASLAISCCLKSTIFNNDLGWRSVFVSVQLLTIFAIYYMGSIKSYFMKTVIILASVYFIWFTPWWIKSKKGYIEPLTPETIAAIQRNIKQTDRFLNNNEREPFGLHANIEFTILTEKMSCYMSYASIRPYCSPALRNLKQNVHRIFLGSIQQKDIKRARQFNCNKFIFFKTDKNFNKDQKLSDLGLHKIYENDQIKIWE